MRIKALLRTLAAHLVLLAAFLPGIASATPGTGYWWNPNEAGRGFVIEIQGVNMFMAGFLYDSNGNATWVASNGPMTTPTQYSGPLITYRGGQTLNGAYLAPTQVIPPIGTLSLTFVNDTHANLTWPGGTMAIQRFDIVPGGSSVAPASNAPQAGWWWNPAEGGRGFAVEVQGGQMYLAAYMYDVAGNTTWYLATGAISSDGTLYQGQWQLYSGGETLNGPYKPPSGVAPAGSVSLQFGNNSVATMTLPNGRQIPFTRFQFGGPTLYTLSAMQAQPASPLTVTTSNIDLSARLALNFSDASGYNVSVPLTAATSNSLTALVPPYIAPSTGAFGSGTVSVKLTEGAGASITNSNALAGFSIQFLGAGRNQPGQPTLSLLRAGLSEAQRLQTSIKGTAQDTPAVQAAIAAQVGDLLQLVNNVQAVVENGLSFSLGVVGGVNITVTASNIADVDRLILASMNALAKTTAGSSKTVAQAPGSGCMAQDASAFAQAIFNGSGNLDNLALALLQAPTVSIACHTVPAFTSAYNIFGGEGASTLGIVNQAGSSLVASNLGSTALFSVMSANANVEVGLNALLAPAFSAQLLSVQNAIGTQTALSQALTVEVLGKASGTIASNLNDSQSFINTIAPPPLLTVPANVPVGIYTLSGNLCTVQIGNTLCQALSQSQVFTVADVNLFKTQLDATLGQACETYGGDEPDPNGPDGDEGFVCSTAYTPYQGTQFKVILTVTGPGVAYVLTYTLTKTG